MGKKKVKQNIFFGVNWLIGIITLAALGLILGFVLVKGLPHVSIEFLTEEPSNLGRDGGIFSVIVGTIYVTLVGIVIATPIGVFGAVYFNEYAKPGKTVGIIRFFTEVLAGIPSIVFGLFGFAFFVIFLNLGWSVLSGGLTLAIMILPTIVRSTEESLKTVPMSYREGSLSLGASKWYTIKKVVLPCCKKGILTGVILGIGRAIGETAAVLLTIGGSLNLPSNIFEPTRTMALHLYMLASEGLSEEKTYATGALLIIIILIINAIANFVASRGAAE
ncbi:MAG: phosphate ABC transporter permease PstA [Anaerovoracaceae bacterium]